MNTDQKILPPERLSEIADTVNENAISEKVEDILDVVLLEMRAAAERGEYQIIRRFDATDFLPISAFPVEVCTRATLRLQEAGYKANFDDTSNVDDPHPYAITVSWQCLRGFLC